MSAGTEYHPELLDWYYTRFHRRAPDPLLPWLRRSSIFSGGPLPSFQMVYIPVLSSNRLRMTNRFTLGTLAKNSVFVLQSSSVEVSSRTPSGVCLRRVFSTEWKGHSARLHGVGFSTSKVRPPSPSRSSPCSCFPTSLRLPNGSPPWRGGWQSSVWKRMRALLTRLAAATGSRNHPCSLFDDRKTSTGPFGEGSGWQLVIGKHGGYVCDNYLKWDPVLTLFSSRVDLLCHRAEF